MVINLLMPCVFAGRAVSLNYDGSILAVGAPDNLEGGQTSGAVLIFNRPGVHWASTPTYEDLAPLLPTSMNACDFFGFSVALNSLGDFCAAGAIGYPSSSTSEGAVFSFAYGVLSPSSWGYFMELNPATGDLQTGDSYGSCVATASAEVTIVSGAPTAFNTRGAVYVIDYY